MRLEAAVSLEFIPSTLTEQVVGEPIVLATQFGRLTLDAGRLVSMPVGLFGFSELTRFGLVPMPGDRSGRFLLLQPAAAADVTFVVVPAEQVGSPIVAEDIISSCQTLGIAPGDGLTLLIVSARNDANGFSMTVNCRAPVFLDTRRLTAWQLVLPSPDYAIRHPIR